jgi:hypothetical protein
VLPARIPTTQLAEAACGVIPPLGKAEPVDGGYRVDPRRRFKDLYLSDRISLIAAEITRTLVAEQARFAHSLHGGVVEAAQFLRCGRVLLKNRSYWCYFRQQLISKRLTLLHCVLLSL